MKYEVNFSAIERVADVELPKLKARLIAQVIEVGSSSRQEIVDSYDRVAVSQKCIAQV
jgi:hypothetical protein